MSHLQNSHPSAELLQALLDGDVSPRERTRLEEHVASCTRCAEELAGWSVLFDDLDELGALGPSEGFRARVMAGVRVPARLPLAARIRTRLAALAPARGRSTEHLDAGLLQDLADGALGARRASRARTHLEVCPTCTDGLAGWEPLFARLSGLDRLDPGEGFADRVMACLAAASEKAAVRRREPAWARALAAARRFLPRTRRAWAALSGAAVTPAVTLGLLLYTVFSHPTLTPQALASYAFWQMTDLLLAAWDGLLSGGPTLARSLGLDGLVGAMVDAPLIAAAGLAIYAVAFVVAVRILYTNLIGRTPRTRYAPASAS
jgi:anti-sigma factor RsiW